MAKAYIAVMIEVDAPQTDNAFEARLIAERKANAISDLLDVHTSVIDTDMRDAVDSLREHVHHYANNSTRS